MTRLAAVLRRLQDLDQYEEYERVAAKVAASMAAYIKKGLPDDYPETPSAGTSDSDRRTMTMKPGMIFDDLLPGEEIGTIDTKRPNVNLEAFRNGQLRAVAGGSGTHYSAIAQDYNGNYSSRRQELVEVQEGYTALAGLFADRVPRPVYERFVSYAQLTGQLAIVGTVDLRTLADADYRGPKMPWIDPFKEIKAETDAVRAGFRSAQQVIRERGGNPREVLQQAEAWNNQADEHGLVLTTNAMWDTAPDMVDATKLFEEDEE